MVVFKEINSKDVLDFTSKREGEIKLGEKVKTFEDFEFFNGKYVLIGVSESVGPQANLGLAGAENGFSSFLTRFLNIQSNRFFDGEEVMVYGEFKAESKEGVSDKRKVVEELDSLLTNHLTKLYDRGFIPILIGGGHNNAYPLMKAFRDSKGQSINVINCDPHADYRLLEGRHSGNSFSYAKKEGSLNYYNVLGLHQSYNSEEMLCRMENDGCDFSFFDDYLVGISDLVSDVDLFLRKNNSSDFGVELDLDSIKGVPSSAYTFSGITVEEARKYVLKLAMQKSVKYLHLPEGAPLNNREEVLVGKTISYLVSDFIKTNLKYNS